MNLSQAAKACVFSLAIIPLVGTSLDFDFGSSRWIMLVAAAVILLPIGAMLAKQMVRAKRVYPVFPAEVTSERISNHLIVLSSAAVLAVYSAGYLRTRPAAERIAARERAAKELTTQISALIPSLPPQAPAPESNATAPTNPPPRKKAARAAHPATPDSTSSDPATNTAQAANPPGPSGVLRDGRYQGRGTSPHGDIVAEIVVQKGQIVYAGIAECLTRYSCSVIHMLPMQVVDRQTRDVDVVSGATESTDAFRDGISVALFKARGEQ